MHVRLGIMHQVAQCGPSLVTAGVQAIERELEEDEKGAVIGMRVFRGWGENLGRLPVADELDDVPQGDLVRGHEDFRHALVGPAHEMDFRQAGAPPAPRDVERRAGFALAAIAPTATSLGIEENLPFHHALRPGIAVAVGQENDAQPGAESRRLLDQTAARERFVVRVRSEIQEAIRGVEA